MKIKIRDIVESLLAEEKEEEKKEEKPKPSASKKSKPGIEASTGSGRFSAGVQEAGALAKENPSQLMKNLKVSSTSGSNDLDKIKGLLQQAFTGTDAMKSVYTGLTMMTKGSKSGLRVDIDTIRVRDGIKYLYHTLVGAKNAGVLSLDSLIQVENSSGSIIIYSGEKRSWDA